MAANESIQDSTIQTPTDHQLGIAPHEQLGSQAVKELLELPEKLLLNSSYLYDVNPECGIALAARKPKQSYPHLNAIYAIAMITLLGNSMMFFLICSNKKFRNQRGNTFMMAIGLCDVLFMIYFCSTNMFFSDIIHKNFVVCKIANIITSYLFVLPWSIFLAVMLDRVIAVAQPILYRKMMKKKMFSPRSVVLSCFLLSLMPCMPLWFDNTSQRNKEELLCDWCYVPHKNTFWVVWQTVLSFLIPFLTIFACWVVMIYLFLTQELNSVLKSVTSKAMCITGFFLICTSPFCTVFFLEGIHILKDNRLQKMTMPLVLVNSVIQPFLYVFINRQLRGRLLRLVCRKKTAEDPKTEVTEITPKIDDSNKSDHLENTDSHKTNKNYAMND